MKLRTVAKAAAALIRTQNEAQQKKQALQDTRDELTRRYGPDYKLLGDPDFAAGPSPHDTCNWGEGSSNNYLPRLPPRNPAIQKPVPPSPTDLLACLSVGGCGIDPDF